MKNLFTYLLLLFSGAAVAQTQPIAGRVIDDKQQAVSFANVLLLNTKDSSFVKGNVADVDGNFTIEQVTANTYLLSVTAVGFQKYYQKVTISETNKTFNISLVADNQTLTEVQVTARKPLIERTGDKMIMNVEASPITSGLNGLELMEKVPGVTVDRNSETIKVKGKAGVTIMIDDRKTYLSNEQLAAFLKTLKSDDIEKIEVITNPSARYDASGTSALINIKTKKGKSLGTNYILDLSAGYSYYDEVGSLPKNGQGITVNSKKEKYTLYANLSRNNDRSFNTSTENQRFLGDGKVLETRDNYEVSEGSYGAWNAKLGFDYDLSKKSTLGFSLQSSLSANTDHRVVEQKATQQAISSLLVLERDRRSNNNNFIFNTHWKHTFDTATVWNTDFDIIYNKALTDNRFLTTTTVDKKVTFVNNQIYLPYQSNTYVFKTDLEKMVTKKIKLETGLKASFSTNDKDFNDNFRDNGALVNAFFRFDQNIFAAYVMVNTELSKNTNLQTGLRGEQTYTRGEDRNGQKLSEQDYFNLFPTIFLNHKVSKNYTVSLGYSRRIERPDDDVFNIYRRFYFPQQYEQGNSNILPILKNSYSFSHTIKDAFSFSFDYVNMQQFWTEVFGVDTTLIPNRRLLRSSTDNVVGKISWWSFDTSIPFDVTKWWNINFNAWTGINVYNYEYENASVDINQWYGGMYLQQTFTLSKMLSAELSGWMSSGETWGFQTSRSQGSFDIGFKQFIWEKKGTIKLSIQDPFYINRWSNNLVTDNLETTGVYRWDNRRIRLNFTYNFGNTVKVNQRNNNGDGGGSKRGGGSRG
ncbi:MAG: outer membrane beta-barrel protein [Arcicella sp.]|nr:outer membrane beta-barrel protein [Arcicella sp.]